MTYECVICLSINHATRLHCQHCGTIPAAYSMIAAPARIIEHYGFSQFIEVKAAHGCMRVCQRRARRLGLFTVPSTYYADGISREARETGSGE